MPGPPIPARIVKTRRIAFDYPAEDLPRHFADGDLVGSHVMAMLSAVFPEGEDFFVRSVRNYRDQVTDPELKQQVGGFIGQEAMHGREHRTFNARLRDLGYPTRMVDRRVHYGLKIAAKVLPTQHQLAITAALEHYTATMAEVILTDERAMALGSADGVRSLFMWHALEETEHKSVAFDVYRAIGGDERLRIRVMRAITVGFVVTMLLNVAISLALDPAARDLGRLRSSLREFRHSPFLSRWMRERLADYNRQGFHPDDHDTSELLAYWREELFGTGGELTELLKSADGG